MARSWPRLLGPLGRRLFAAFTLVALGAVALLAAVATLSVADQTNRLDGKELARSKAAIIEALRTAYARAGSWDGVDLAAVQALAEAAGIRLLVLDQSGGEVADVAPHDGVTSSEVPHPHPSDSDITTGATSSVSTPSRTIGRTATPRSSTGQGVPKSDPHSGHGQWAAPALRTVRGTGVSTTAAPPTAVADGATPIVVDGQRVGSVVFDARAAGDTATGQARSAILEAVGLGGVLAVLLAAAAALLVSRRITRPLRALVGATEAVERGASEASLPPAPGELGQLGRAFDRMARSLHREDDLRRAVVADVAHELRTPVTILRGLTEELLDGLAAPTPERLSSLHDEVLRLGRLVDDLAALAAAQASALSIRRAVVDLGRVTADVVAAMQPQFVEAGLDVQLETAPVVVDGDDERLRQVVTNLLTNAVKFTPDGGRIGVGVERAHGQAVVTVTDSGPGIPPDELPHVFERFWRGRAAAGRAGSGIGLAVVAALVDAHGGTVEASNLPTGGARFTIRLPAA